MPTSDISSVPAIVNEIWRLQPKRVLDLGAGSGKYGVLAREYLDIGVGRIGRDQWQVCIDAVEGFAPYINELHYAVYNNVYVGDFYDPYGYYMDYDLVLMIDSLEHLDKEKGMKLLMKLRRYNKDVLVSCPFGSSYQEQGAVNGNEFERHRAHWEPMDFAMLGGVKIYHGVCAVYRLPGRQ